MQLKAWPHLPSHLQLPSAADHSGYSTWVRGQSIIQSPKLQNGVSFGYVLGPTVNVGLQNHVFSYVHQYWTGVGAASLPQSRSQPPER